MSRTCDECRLWNRGTLGTNQTGFCRSRRHQREAARELNTSPRQIGQLITWHDNTCDHFSPFDAPIRSDRHAEPER